MKTLNYTTKKILLSISPVFVAFTLLTIPPTSHALSCLNPTEMVDSFVSDDRYTIVRVEAGEIETMGDEHDQYVTVIETLKSDFTDSKVTFNWDETWQYLCVGGPAEAGSEAVYIVSEGQVVQIANLESPLYEALMSALEVAPEETEPATPVVEPDQSLMLQIIDLLRQMINLLTGDVTIEDEESVTPPETSMGIHDSIIGLSEIEAAAYAVTQDVAFRVGRRDGEFLPVTMDYRPGRITAEVENSIVTAYTVEGEASF